MANEYARISKRNNNDLMRYGKEERYVSVRDDYKTPEKIYKPLLDLFGIEKFNFDVCCTEENIPAYNYFTKDTNGLSKDWSGVCFCNPPWQQTQKWIKKGFQTVKDAILVKETVSICYVIPSNRMETGYMQDCVINNPYCVWGILPGKQGFIIPGYEDVLPVPSVGVAVAILTTKPFTVHRLLKTQNPFNTTYYLRKEN